MLCSIGVEKALRRLEGVDTVRVSLEDKIAEVTLKPRTVFDPEKIRTAIAQDGESVRSFELQMRATVEQRDGRYWLQPQGVAQQFIVRSGPFTAKLASLIGSQVRVKGKLAGTGPPLELELIDIAIPDSARGEKSP